MRSVPDGDFNFLCQSIAVVRQCAERLSYIHICTYILTSYTLYTYFRIAFKYLNIVRNQPTHRRTRPTHWHSGAYIHSQSQPWLWMSGDVWRWLGSEVSQIAVVVWWAPRCYAMRRSRSAIAHNAPCATQSVLMRVAANVIWDNIRINHFTVRFVYFPPNNAVTHRSNIRRRYTCVYNMYTVCGVDTWATEWARRRKNTKWRKRTTH